MPRFIQQATVIATPTAVSYPLGIHDAPQNVGWMLHAASAGDLGVFFGTGLTLEFSLQPADTATLWKPVANLATTGVTAGVLTIPAQALRITSQVSGSGSPFYSWSILQTGL